MHFCIDRLHSHNGESSARCGRPAPPPLCFALAIAGNCAAPSALGAGCITPAYVETVLAAEPWSEFLPIVTVASRPVDGVLGITSLTLVDRQLAPQT